MARKIRSRQAFRIRDVAGSAAIEFGLFVPLLATLLIGVVEIGFAMYGSMQVYNAVEAGALYAAKNGWDSAKIASAVVNSTGVSGITATPAPSQFCGCPTTTGITAKACGSTCAGGITPSQYIRVNATLTRTTIFSDTSLGLPATLTAQSTLRQN